MHRHNHSISGFRLWIWDGAFLILVLFVFGDWAIFWFDGMYHTLRVPFFVFVRCCLLGTLLFAFLHLHACFWCISLRVLSRVFSHLFLALG